VDSVPATGMACRQHFEFLVTPRMTRGQVLEPITTPQNIFLSRPQPVPAPFAPHPRPLLHVLSPSPPRYRRQLSNNIIKITYVKFG